MTESLEFYIKESFKYLDGIDLKLSDVFDIKDNKIKDILEEYFSESIGMINKISYNYMNDLYEKFIYDDKKYMSSETSIRYLKDQLKSGKLDVNERSLYKDLLSTLEFNYKSEKLRTEMQGNVITEYLSDIEYFSIVITYLKSMNVEYPLSISSMNINEFNRYIVFPYYRLLYLTKDKMSSVKIKNTNINLHDYFINLVREYINSKIESNENLRGILNVLTNEHEYHRSPQYIDYREGTGNNLLSLIIDRYFNEFEDLVYALINKIMNNSFNREIKEEFLYDIYKPNILLIDLFNDEIITGRRNTFNNKNLVSNRYNVRKIDSTAVNYKDPYCNHLLGHYINDIYIEKNKLNKYKMINKTRALKSLSYLTNQRCIIDSKEYYDTLFKYFYDPKNLTRKEFEVSNLLIKLIMCSNSYKLKSIINKINNSTIINKLMDEKEIKKVIEIGIKMNINSIFYQKGLSKINHIDLSVGNIITPLIFNKGNDNEDQIDIINTVFDNFTYDIDINFDKYYFKDLNEYFENRINIELLYDLDIDVVFDIKYDKISKTIVTNISKKLKGRYDFEVNELIISYDKININRLPINEFCNGLCDYLDQFFPEKSSKLRKSFRSELVKNIFR